MGMLSRKLRNLAGGGLGYWCQGCDMMHQIWVGEGQGPRWAWNGNVERPTFTPSVLVQWNQAEPQVTPENLEHYKTSPWQQTQVQKVCHTFITDGRVQFLGDCTHQYAGQTLDLPDLPGDWQDLEATP